VSEFCYTKRGGNKFCSRDCYHSSQRKNKVIELDGDIFYLNVHGYYRSEKTGLLLHRYVWESKFGKIPKGCLIHHIDGDKDNNKVDNLSLITITEHSRLHYKSGLLAHNRSRPINICKVNGCSGKVKGYNLCSKHYQRLTKLRRDGMTFIDAVKQLA
jgi:hypothetical protein